MPSVSHGKEQTRKKEKKREKKEWNSERLKYGQPQSNKGISIQKETYTAHLSSSKNLHKSTQTRHLGQREFTVATADSLPVTDRSLLLLPYWYDASHNALRWSCFSRIPIRVKSDTPKRTVCVWVWLGREVYNITRCSDYQFMSHLSKYSTTFRAVLGFCIFKQKQNEST